ncbi:DUF4352 domain-containing protein [Paenibacillus sp. FSL W8-0426]|uniref:DUF4352 domain-containing protein n=1 Tax=Paenibacillus sp. FSL W8-0426 TaxID=2921714 RepID=UPI0030D96FE3
MWILIGFVVVVIGAITLTLSNPLSSRVTESVPVTATPGLNSEIEVGTFAVTVHSVDESEASSNGVKTVTLDMSARNDADKAGSFTSDQVKLRDSAGREYEPKLGGLGNMTINPGITEKGTVSFEVSESAEITEALIRADMFDMGGADYVRVDLTKGDPAQ